MGSGYGRGADGVPTIGKRPGMLGIRGITGGPVVDWYRDRGTPKSERDWRCVITTIPLSFGRQVKITHDRYHLPRGFT